MLGRLIVAFFAGMVYATNKTTIDNIVVNGFNYFDDIISSKIGD